MLNNFRNLNALYRSLGANWLIFRVGYALRLRMGLIRRQMPVYRWQDRPLGTWLKRGVPSQPEVYAQWRRQHAPKFFFNSLRAERYAVEAQVPWDAKLAVKEAERLLKGGLRYFTHEYFKTGFPPNWHRDPVSGKTLDSTKHWSEISNEGEVDVKFIWEASRFNMVYTLVRACASTRDERFAEAFWELIRAWAESNPPNMGPNWMDGQEVALRLMAWTFGFYAFMDSPSSTPTRIAQFTVMVAAHAERIYRNIDYAISTRSNHTISEAFGLWLVGLLFPELKDAGKYFSFGRKLLEQESLAQIFPDGSYSMYSLNYHRFILHIYLYAIRLGELNGAPFSETLQVRVAKSVEYLSQLIDPETGQMPVYGSNDGALVLPLNNCDFTDYRPLLQLGSYLTKKELPFEPGPWDEDVFWFYGETFPSPEERGVRGDGKTSFPYAGMYILHGTNSKAVIRCTDFRARPSHADQLHVDLWWHGVNIACDAGTYLYSGEGVWRNGLARTPAHNTVIVDRQDQMKMVSRFTWTNWAKGRVLHQDEKIWQGEHNGYRQLTDPVDHKRTLLSLGEDRWLVVDHLDGRQIHHYSLHWLLCDSEYGVQNCPNGRASANFGIKLDTLDGKPSDSKVFIQMGLLEGTGNFSVVRAEENSTRGWRSRYYGQKEPALSAMLETDQPRACFWTYFGLETDTIELMRKTLKINSGNWNAQINLSELMK